MTSLNPVLKVGFQMCEAMKKHTSVPGEKIRQRALDLLEKVHIDDPEGCLEKYPHEFSGGMRQRIMIASSLMMAPALLIADEPTTALDCLVQKDVLDILLDLAHGEGTAILLISHDLAHVAQYANRVLVMEKGKIVEQGPVEKVIGTPAHPYTRKLLSALPQPGPEKEDPAREKMVEIKNLSVDYPIRRKWFFEKQTFKRVLNNVSLDIHMGETLAVVGESGSGKTTIGRAILQLVKPAEGSIQVDYRCVSGDNAPGFEAMSQTVQLIFQDPYSSLSPRQTIEDIIGEPVNTPDREERVREMLDDVGLGPEFATRLPNELSGGQRQRVAIARALINNPKLVIADEPVSALDITIQAQILELLQRLKEKNNFTCLFISHDLGVVEQVADRIIVLYQGQIVEEGCRSDIFNRPQHPYTRALLSALPELKMQGTNSYSLHQRLKK